MATLSISYYDIGKKAGEMAYDILVNGADITTMKIETAPKMCIRDRGNGLQKVIIRIRSIQKK